MMDVEKLKYSKCPHCRKYGIKANRGIYRNHTFPIRCKHCGKFFQVNSALSFFNRVTSILLPTIILFIIDKNLFHIHYAAIMVIAYLIYVICLRFYPMEELIPKYACPCCGARSFIFNEKSIYQEVCPVCLWKNDPFQKDNPTFPEGINNISLEEAKRNYQTIGVCKPEYVNKN